MSFPGTTTATTAATNYGFCVVQDELGNKAIAHVPRSLCLNGYSASEKPHPSFVCQVEEGSRQAASDCYVPAGTWVDNAVQLVNPDTETVCFRVVDQPALDKALEISTRPDPIDGTVITSILPFAITNVPKCPY